MVNHFNLTRNISIVLIGLLIFTLVGMGLAGVDGESVLIALSFGSILILFQILSIAGESRMDENMRSTALIAGPISFGFVMGSLLFFHGLVMAELFENHFHPEIFFLLGIVVGVLTWIAFTVISIRKGPETLRGEFLRMSMLWTVLPALFSIPWGLLAMNQMEKRSGWFSGITGGFLVAWSCVILIWAIVPFLFTLISRYRERMEEESSVKVSAQPFIRPDPQAELPHKRENRREAPFED